MTLNFVNMKLLLSMLSLLWLARVVDGDVLDLVDPLIGTVGGGEWALHRGLFSWRVDNHCVGHVFPGATLPFGMAKAVADVDKETQGGYASNDADSESLRRLHVSFFVDVLTRSR